MMGGASGLEDRSPRIVPGVVFCRRVGAKWDRCWEGRVVGWLVLNRRLWSGCLCQCELVGWAVVTPVPLRSSTTWWRGLLWYKVVTMVAGGVRVVVVQVLVWHWGLGIVGLTGRGTCQKGRVKVQAWRTARTWCLDPQWYAYSAPYTSWYGLGKQGWGLREVPCKWGRCRGTV